MSTLYSATAAMANGASTTQVLVGVALGAGTGFFGGAIGGAVADQFTQSLTVKIVSGAIGGAASAAFSSLAMGHGLSWGNILESAAIGAATAAISWGLSDHMPSVDQATAKHAPSTPQQGSGYDYASQVGEPAITGQPYGDPYPNMRAAAASVLDAYDPLSEARHTEYSGLLYELDGEHYATPGVPGGEDGSNPNQARQYLPDGAMVEGYWHNHGSYDFKMDVSIRSAGGWDWNERFSDADVTFRLRSTIPGSIQAGYVGTPAGMMFEFNMVPGLNASTVLPTQVGGAGWLGGYGFQKR